MNTTLFLGRQLIQHANVSYISNYISMCVSHVKEVEPVIVRTFRVVKCMAEVISRTGSCESCEYSSCSFLFAYLNVYARIHAILSGSKTHCTMALCLCKVSYGYGIWLRINLHHQRALLLFARKMLSLAVADSSRAGPFLLIIWLQDDPKRLLNLRS